MRLLVPALVLAVLPTLAPAAEPRMRPGQWQFTVKVTAFDLPGAPPQVVEALRKPTATSRCITPEQAASGPIGMIRDKDNCRIDRQSVDNGRFDAVVVCQRPEGTITQKAAGTLTPTTLSMNSVTETTGQKVMKMTAVTTGEWVGDCK